MVAGYLGHDKVAAQLFGSNIALIFQGRLNEEPVSMANSDIVLM